MKPATVRPGARLLSMNQVEAEYGIPADTLTRLIKEGHLRVVEPPSVRRRFIDRHDLDAALEQWKESR